MNLYELAFTCYVYNFFTSFNQTYKDLQKNTKDSVDLRQETHRKDLIVWLNKWGCRQFALDYHQEASGELLAWYKKGHVEKLPISKNLWDLNNQELDQVVEIFDSLACRIASKVIRNEKSISKSFGSTGASKILFALRPNIAVPWDSYIRNGLGYSMFSPLNLTLVLCMHRELMKMAMLRFGVILVSRKKLLLLLKS